MCSRDAAHKARAPFVGSDNFLNREWQYSAADGCNKRIEDCRQRCKVRLRIETLCSTVTDTLMQEIDDFRQRASISLVQYRQRLSAV